MTDFSKYVMKFMKNTDTYQSHLSFTKGKYNVPESETENFHKKYYTSLITGEKLYLIEKICNCNFKFFVDLDTIDENDNDILEVIHLLNKTILKMFVKSETDYNDYTENIVSKRNSKYHINYPNLVVNSAIAVKIIKEFKREYFKEKENDARFIDVSVYRTGLRMIGSRKNPTEETVYRIYNLETGKYIKMSSLLYDTFLKTTIRTTEDPSEICEIYKKKEPEKLKGKDTTIKVKGVENTEVINELELLVNDLKVTNECISDFDTKIERVYAKQNKLGLFCYYVSINQSICPFKKQKHKRESNPLYLEINDQSVSVKCYNEECLKLKYPENGLKMPSTWKTNYKQLYLSMTSKYWESEVTITDEIRKCLEDSLNASHYNIAKCAFLIYRDRFRVDDIKNTNWYEFDSVRWKRSDNINILISEELPKYYRGIKTITPTTENEDLHEFLEKKDNIRNKIIDGIVVKLENMNFKSKIIEQMTYLFKTYDPDFYINLDTNPYLIGFKNGVYDFRLNEFRKATLDDYLTFTTGYDWIDYDESDANIRDIYTFLRKIIPNEKVFEYLLKVLGKSLLGLPDEKFFIWTGISGANGKSTLVNFLEAALGDYTTSIDVSLLTNKRSNSSNASPDVVRLKGKRLFTFQEPESQDTLRTGILKQFSGGDTIVARELFKAPITFKLQGTMIMCCNELPSINSIDGGSFRRIRVFDFPSRFCENPKKKNEFKIDPYLKTKLQEWKPYFMSILVYWYNKYVYEGLDEPLEVMKATMKYKADNDKFNEFFEQVVSENESAFETVKNIYSTFQSWWISNYSTSKVPELKQLKRALQIKYGTEQEQIINKSIKYGFNVSLKSFVDYESD